MLQGGTDINGDGYNSNDLLWVAANQNDLGHVAVSFDGRLALWVEGFTGNSTPAGVLLLRAQAPRAPVAP